MSGWQSHAVSLDSEQAAAALDASGLPLPERGACSGGRAGNRRLASQRGGLAVLDPGRPDRLIVDESLRTTVRTSTSPDDRP